MRYSIHAGVTKTKLNVQKLAMAGVALAFAASIATVGSPASAAAGHTLFGDASVVPGGNPGNAASLPSDTSLPNGYGGVHVVLPAGIPWASLATLSTDYNVTDDNCGGGSPRVSLGIDTNSDSAADGYVHVALGPSPAFTGCAAGWQTTGNLIGNSDAGRYDYSQFGGSPFTTYSGAPASVLAGTVVKAFVVVDGSWSAAATGGDSEQTVLVDNLTVNSLLVTFEPDPTKESCKGGGWQTMTSPGPFKNQGDCVSYFATKGKNGPNGQ